MSEITIRPAGKDDCLAITELALMAGASISSIEVFIENTGAPSLYERLGYQVIGARPVVQHACHPFTTKIVLLTREVIAQ